MKTLANLSGACLGSSRPLNARTADARGAGRRPSKRSHHSLTIKYQPPQAAIDSLAPAERFGRLFAVVRLTKGLALLRARSPSAAAEFQRIVDTQEAIAQILYGYPYPCALVGLARARTASGDSPGARQAYERLLDLWKHADQDLPLLADVRRELAAVPPSAAKGTLRE